MARLAIRVALPAVLALACVSVPPPAPLHFAVDDDQLRDAAAEREIEDTAAALREDPDLHLLIVGHADEDNTDEYNRELSRRRAMHVHDRILAIAPELDDRIRIEARSEWDASDRGDDERAKTRNRRVELRFYYPRRCEPSFDAEFLACEWSRLPPPTPPPEPDDVPAPDEVPAPDVEPTPTPSRRRQVEFLGPYVFASGGYSIASSEYLRQYVGWGVGAGHIWGFGKEYRIALGLSFNHLVDVGSLFPGETGLCAPFCQYIDHSRLRVTPEVRIGGSKGVLWGWVRVAGGVIVQHYQATRDGDPPMIVAPQGWNPGGTIGIGPGVAIAVTGHLFLLIDGMVSYARVPAVDRGGAGIDASVGLGWVF